MQICSMKAQIRVEHENPFICIFKNTENKFAFPIFFLNPSFQLPKHYDFN